MHKASSMKTWCVKVGVEELECPAQSPDLNPTEHHWDELEHRLHPRPPHIPTSAPDLTNALVVERTQIPTATLQHLVEKSGPYYNCKEGINLECNVQQAHMDDDDNGRFIFFTPQSTVQPDRYTGLDSITVNPLRSSASPPSEEMKPATTAGLKPKTVKAAPCAAVSG
ncbi:hypothetical protein PDJAM_G00237750 [Pangasius djambal]|uniref:Uncharacterized protein n=1 Tax=Pangasius djambal TaxID=1691987 RepID=A0ACC5YHW3_9TELE|nr:hypothetical protein [Pangasius djambal]